MPRGRAAIQRLRAGRCAVALALACGRTVLPSEQGSTRC